MKNKKLFAILTLVCFMMTLMPVAAFAAPADIVADSLSAVEAEVKGQVAKDDVYFNLSLKDVNGDPFATTTTLYAWVTKVGSNVPVNTVKFDGNDAGTVLYTIPSANAKTMERAFRVAFNAAGNYQVHVSTASPDVTSGTISAANEFNNTGAVVEVTPVGSLQVAGLRLGVELDGALDTFDVYANTTAVTPIASAQTRYDLADGQIASKMEILANNVEEEKVTLWFQTYDASGNLVPLQGMPLKIDTAGAIDVSDDVVYTGVTGKAEFAVSGHSEGTYKIYVSYGQFEAVIEVQVGAVAANTIEATKVPSNPIDILGTNLTTGLEDIEFTMYDVNGNAVKPVVGDSVAQGWDKAKTSGNDVGKTTGYVAIVDQPAKSALKNEHLAFTGKYITSEKAITVEGDYTFKVVLDNGNYATATITVKAFTSPVKLVVPFPATVELGSTVYWSKAPYWLDANGVEKAAKGVEVAATGYAVNSFGIQSIDVDGDAIDEDTAVLTVKTDEKYVGSTITITAVDERHDLITTATVKVADEAAALKFATETATVKVNNKIKVNVVDANGNVVALGNTNGDQGNATVDYVILDKPEGARVFVSTVENSLARLTSQGYFTMNLTCDKVGTVKVQAIVRYNEVDFTGKTVVKYYTGTQEFAVGTGEIGKSVVMSIGSNELIVGSKVTTMDAKPMIQNSRTYVPFRALAEAFGATVAYDQATSSVTAELNGVKVVMTVGSPVYTVNGVEKTADVAPFISDSRTFVPVRFAAEAFGIEVVPTYNTDGSVADVLFNM